MRWGGLFDVDGLRLQIDRLTDRTLQPGFWDDQQQAQKQMRRLDEVKEQLAQLRLNVGFIFQAHNLMMFLTARRNVRLSLELHDAYMEQNLDQLAAEMLEKLGMVQEGMVRLSDDGDAVCLFASPRAV